MHLDWEYHVEEELSPQADGSGQELCLGEEATRREFQLGQAEMTIQEVFPWGAVRHQEWQQCEGGVTVQWADGTQQQLCQWAQSVTVQEL